MSSVLDVVVLVRGSLSTYQHTNHVRKDTCFQVLITNIYDAEPC